MKLGASAKDYDFDHEHTSSLNGNCSVRFVNCIRFQLLLQTVRTTHTPLCYSHGVRLRPVFTSPVLFHTRLVCVRTDSAKLSGKKYGNLATPCLIGYRLRE